MEQVTLDFKGFLRRCEREILELLLHPDAAGQALPEVTVCPANFVRAESTVIGSIAKSEGTDWRNDLSVYRVVIQGKWTA
jgi:hypothetical protein